MPKIKPFDPSEFLDDDEVVAEYLTAARNPAGFGYCSETVSYSGTTSS
jgi:DNA-binding phage protein